MAVKLLALALVALACAAAAEEVITLTDKNFDDAIKNNQFNSIDDDDLKPIAVQQQRLPRRHQ